MLAISILLVRFSSSCYYVHIFLLLLVSWFSCFCLFMYTYGARTHGARAWFPRCKQKGHRCKHAEQLRLLGLGFSFSLLLCILYTPLFLFPFPLRWYVLGISCCIPFVLISRVWRPLFTFLHLYFRPCSRDVGIYFPALCASIVHDACIYIYLLAPFQCDCHDLCHLRLAMPNFRRESKVTSCRVFGWKSSILLKFLRKA